MTVIVCSECFARSDDPEGHAPTCRSTGGWSGSEEAPRDDRRGAAPELDAEALARAALRSLARQACEEHGNLWSERHERLLNQGIRLLGLFRND